MITNALIIHLLINTNKKKFKKLLKSLRRKKNGIISLLARCYRNQSYWKIHKRFIIDNSEIEELEGFLRLPSVDLIKAIDKKYTSTVESKPVVIRIPKVISLDQFREKPSKNIVINSASLRYSGRLTLCKSLFDLINLIV